jgi:pyruvate formate lyase activating enzyme
LQPNFAPHLLHACHDYGVNTAIETTGFAKWETIQKYLPHLDYVLMDIKHMNSAKHRAFTSQPNELIHENARKIAQSGMVDLTIRVPVIPTFNATPEEIYDIAMFAASLPNVEKLHLLPYHRLGQGKYEGLGRPYLMEGTDLIPNEYMLQLLHAAEKSGLKCQIGG